MPLPNCGPLLSFSSACRVDAKDKTKVVKIRIAVAVDKNGFWSAAGNCVYESDEDAATGAMDYMPLERSSNSHIVWLDAEVPLPETDGGKTGEA